MNLIIVMLIQSLRKHGSMSDAWLDPGMARSTHAPVAVSQRVNVESSVSKAQAMAGGNRAVHTSGEDGGVG